MRIGFYAGGMSPQEVGGGNIFQTNIINAIKKVKTPHEIYFYYISSEDLFEDSENVKFKNLAKIMKVKKDLKYRISKLLNKEKNYKITFDKIVKEDKIDLVYFCTIQYQHVEIPYFITVWDIAHKEFPFFPEVSYTQWTYDEREKFYNEVLPKASKVIIGNSEGKRQLSKYYNINEDNIATIPMMTPDDVYTINGDNNVLEKLNLKKYQYLYYPAQFWAHKNHIRLLKELKKLKELKEKNLNLKLVFSGSDQGNLNYIKEQTQKLDLSDDVIFAGFLKREEVIALYKNAYALAYASYFGPDNIPPLEAMALDCPVICSEYKGAREQLKDCVLFFNPKTGENFIDNIKQLDNKDIRNELIQKGQLLAKSCNMEQYIVKIFNIISDFEQIRECWHIND